MALFSDDYPEHRKLHEVAGQSQACGEFIEWLSGTKKLKLCEWVDVHEDTGDYEDDGWYLQHTSIVNLLAEFFDIDQVKIEDEKRAMLDSIRENNK